MMLEFSQEDIFLVTGASSGIGQAIAQKFNEQGATVIAVGRNEERLNETRKVSKCPEKIFLEPKDLMEDMDSLPFWIKKLKETYGKLKGLVCCAGIVDILPLQSMEQHKLSKLFDINYFVPILLAKGFSDKRNNIGEGASITFIASVAGLTPNKGQIAYAGSKAALIISAKAISHELAEKKIRVNCISPGDIETPMIENSIIEYNYAPAKNYPLGIGKTSDVAELAVFLGSSKSRWITGQNYILDGGYTIC